MVFRLQELPPHLAAESDELAQLQALQRAGLVVAPTLVLVGVETEFYQLSNLAEQVRHAFAGVFGVRIDEKKLESACTLSEKLLRESYLLPERSEQIRAVLPEGPALVRYAGAPPFGVETGKQETLWALKRLWASRWQLDAVLGRQPELAPPQVASLVQSVGVRLAHTRHASNLAESALSLDEALSARASEVLGQRVGVWVCAGRVVRLAPSLAGPGRTETF
jgi:hypothetical protein